MTMPLEGIRVLDASGFISGPTCTAILASMGAEVVKLEPPAGDGIRKQGPYVYGRSYPFEFLNHNKRSIVINLKSEGGPSVVHNLIRNFDVFVQNWRPGTAERLHVGYEDLASVNPGLIYCSISGFGKTGPYSDRGAVDIVAQAMGGLMAVTGEPGRPPVKVSYPITDVGASLWGVISIMAALTARRTTNRGQFVDVALLDSPVSWSFWEAAQFFGTGEVPAPLGSSHRNATPYRAFECADGSYVAVGVASERLWAQFCHLLEIDELQNDERFRTVDDRRDHRAALEKILEGIFVKKTRQEWLDILLAENIPAGPVYRYDEMVADPQVRYRGLIGSLAVSDTEAIEIPDVPLFMSTSTREKLRPAPALGADTRSVLLQGGYTAAEVDQMFASGVAGSNEAPRG